MTSSGMRQFMTNQGQALAEPAKCLWQSANVPDSGRIPSVSPAIQNGPHYSLTLVLNKVCLRTQRKIREMLIK